MITGFYRAFENEFRGDRELIKGRLKKYLPFIEPLKHICHDAVAIDLGCGRGEWLELLAEQGVPACGVDLDDGMLAACKERSLNAENGEAISYLQGLPDQSVSIVSAFHVAEHISFENLQILVEESMRVLIPAGLLILETPNPENIVVGTSNFYLDPSHVKPIPPQLLEFLPNFFGFKRVKLIRLQESIGIKEKSLSLFDVLAGASPDYAVVAQKAAPDAFAANFDDAFGAEYGVSMLDLAARYSEQVDNSIVATVGICIDRVEGLGAENAVLKNTVNSLEERNAQQVNEVAHAKEALSQITSENFSLKYELSAEREASNELRRLLVESNAGLSGRQKELDLLRLELLGVYGSRSWRVTLPLRKLSQIVALIIRLPRRFLRFLVLRCMAFVLSRQKFKTKCLSVLKRFPFIYRHLRLLGIASGLLESEFGAAAEDETEVAMRHLSPHARRIYTDLVGRKSS